MKGINGGDPVYVRVFVVAITRVFGGIILLALFTGNNPLQAQYTSPYTLKSSREWALSGAGVGLNLSSWMLGKQQEPLDDEALQQLDATRLWGIDEYSIRQQSLRARATSDRMLYSSFALPLTMLVAGEASRQDFGRVGLLSLQTILLNSGVTNLTKVLVKRPRPYLYRSEVSLELRERVSSRYSFFSGHTSQMAAMSFLSAGFYADYYPESKARPVVWTVAAAVPAFMGWQRIRAGKHYFTDVLTGYAVGAVIGLAVPALHQR